MLDSSMWSKMELFWFIEQILDLSGTFSLFENLKPPSDFLFIACSAKTKVNNVQGSLTEREGSVRLTSLHLPVYTSLFKTENIIYLCYKTSYLNEEVNCTEPFPSVSIPCTNLQLNKKCKMPPGQLCMTFFGGFFAEKKLFIRRYNFEIFLIKKTAEGDTNVTQLI